MLSPNGFLLSYVLVTSSAQTHPPVESSYKTFQLSCTTPLQDNSSHVTRPRPRPPSAGTVRSVTNASWSRCAGPTRAPGPQHWRSVPRLKRNTRSEIRVLRSKLILNQHAVKRRTRFRNQLIKIGIHNTPRLVRRYYLALFDMISLLFSLAPTQGSLIPAGVLNH